MFRQIVLLLLVSTPAMAQDLYLREGWSLQSSAQVEASGEALSRPDYDAKDWYSTTVPKTVLAALVDNGVYPDPYYGLNLKSIPGYRDGLWLVMPEDSPFRPAWWYRTTFEVPADAAEKHAFICLDGINFEANVWLNGTRIADSTQVRGMFRRFRLATGTALRPGEQNALAIEILPPGLIPDKDYGTKQVQATTGWDDHNPQPPDGNMGLWRDVYIALENEVELQHPYVDTKLETPALASAALTASVYVTNHSNTEQQGELSVAWSHAEVPELRIAQPVTLAPGETREVIFAPESFAELNIADPKVWWPHPLGPQHLYNARFEFRAGDETLDTARTRFGIREITTYINDQDWRVYRVNGQDTLIRGGAWMTSDMLLNLSDERYRALVTYAREGGLNMLRSEGFSIRETEAFYNACDELGVMVTQQIFGRSIPDEELAIACIDDMMLRVRTHPSLAHFLGHDETFPTKTLDAAYRELIEKHRVNRTYQPHSGTFYVVTRKRTGGTRTGTRELWTYASPSHYYFSKSDGAWGFAQSGGIGGIVAMRDSLEQMLPEDQRWPALETEAWSFHTVTQGADYFDAFRVAMAQSYGAPADLDDFCRKAYAMNYASARGMYEAYGRNKYQATGITTWKYDAAWPAAMTWQYIDWYLRPTAAYFGAKKACQPLHAQYAYDDETVYVVNSLRAPMAQVRVKATVLGLDAQVLGTQDAVLDVAADGVAKGFKIAVPEGVGTTYLLRLQLDHDTSGTHSVNDYWLSLTPDIPGTSGHRITGIFYTQPRSRADFTALASLAPTSLEATRDGNTVTVTNSGDALAFGVLLSLHANAGAPSLAPVYWGDNYLMLLPGESRTVSFEGPAIPDDAVVQVEAWNAG